MPQARRNEREARLRSRVPAAGEVARPGGPPPVRVSPRRCEVITAGRGRSSEQRTNPRLAVRRSRRHRPPARSDRPGWGRGPSPHQPRGVPASRCRSTWRSDWTDRPRGHPTTTGWTFRRRPCGWERCRAPAPCRENEGPQSADHTLPALPAPRLGDEDRPRRSRGCCPERLEGTANSRDARLRGGPNRAPPRRRRQSRIPDAAESGMWQPVASPVDPSPAQYASVVLRNATRFESAVDRVSPLQRASTH